ncbi:MAG: M23 family metallopeptidase [Clostridiales bacterium]|nr:M23 family metallopeptidase [Clostridiales bacterium]
MIPPSSGKNIGKEVVPMDNNNFPRRNRQVSKKRGFMDRQGVYAIAVACLILVGVAAYFTFDSFSSTAARPTPEGQQALIAQTPRPTTAPVIKTPEPTKAPEPTAAPVVQVVKESMAKPFDYEVLRPYSPEDPIYFESLKEWTVHTGADLSAKAGTQVKACLSGTVTAVVNDAALGYTITITSDGGRKLVYSNLATLDQVKKGQKVKKGDVISTLGNSASSTKGDPAHLHLEYYLNDKPKDPIAAME